MVAIQAFNLLPIACVAPLGHVRFIPSVLIGLACIHYFCSGAGTPIWNSLIGDLVPAQRRGTFFGLRSKRCGMATFLALVAAGGILEISRNRGNAAWGFCLIFIGAAIARAVSCYWLTQHADPPYEVQAKDEFSFLGFLRESRHANYARFVFFYAWMNFSIFIAAPYFSVYMLRDLALPYSEFTLLTSLFVLAQYFALGTWGELSDRFGNKGIVDLCAMGLCLVPALWVVSSNLIYLCVVQLYAGYTFAGFNLAATNFLFDAVPPAQRARAVAYQSVINGAFMFVGAMLGGYLSDHPILALPHNPWLAAPASPVLFVFLLSSIARGGAVSLFLSIFREVREVEKIRHHQLIFKVAGLRAVNGITFTVVGQRLRRAAKPKDQK
jgi:MFS family permease